MTPKPEEAAGEVSRPETYMDRDTGANQARRDTAAAVRYIHFTRI